MSDKMNDRAGEGRKEENPYIVGTVADRKAAHLAALEYGYLRIGGTEEYRRGEK